MKGAQDRNSLALCHVCQTAQTWENESKTQGITNRCDCEAGGTGGAKADEKNMGETQQLKEQRSRGVDKISRRDRFVGVRGGGSYKSKGRSEKMVRCYRFKPSRGRESSAEALRGKFI